MTELNLVVSGNNLIFDETKQHMETPITKSEVKKLSVNDVLKHIYDNELSENSLNEMSKEKLKDFILEVFNKGIISNYLGLR